MGEFLKLTNFFGPLAERNKGNPILTIGSFWNQLGHDELQFYTFLKEHRNVPSLKIDQDWKDPELHNRINQLESEFLFGTSVNNSVFDPSVNNSKNKTQNKKKIKKDKKSLSKRTKRKRSKSHSSTTSSEEENLEDNYVAATKLSMKKDIFNNWDLKYNRYGISFSN